MNRHLTYSWLSGGVTVRVIQSRCCRYQFACHDADLFINSRTPRNVVGGQFAGRAVDGFNRLKTYIATQPTQTGMFLFRTHVEQMYFDRLNSIPAATIKSWRGFEMVANEAWCGSHLLLTAELRHKKTSYCQYLVRQEWFMRSKYGLSVPYQCMTTLDVRGDFGNAAFPRLTSFWKRIEVPRICYAEIPPLFTYKAKEFRDENLAWLVVTCTEFVARKLHLIFFEAQDNLRMWVVSGDNCRLARDLNLEPILGSMENVTEALRILEVVENTRFEKMSRALEMPRRL